VVVLSLVPSLVSTCPWKASSCLLFPLVCPGLLTDPGQQHRHCQLLAELSTWGSWIPRWSLGGRDRAAALSGNRSGLWDDLASPFPWHWPPTVVLCTRAGAPMMEAGDKPGDPTLDPVLGRAPEQYLTCLFWGFHHAHPSFYNGGALFH
jgi:hypothetical protein